MFAFTRRFLAPTRTWPIRLSRTISRIEVEDSRSVLVNGGFSLEEADTILTNLGPYLKKDSHRVIHSSLGCWRKHMTTNKGDSQLNEQLFTNVFFAKEPRLLLLKSEYILERIELLKSLDVVRGRNDLWTVFLDAPSGFYLQEWNEFLKKYFYVTYKVLRYLEPKIEQEAINPIMSYPAVMELSYVLIKTRFLFAQRTGSKSANLKQTQKINMTTLFQMPIEQFIHTFAPGCTVEEFRALEKLNSSLDGEEDDKLFEDLVNLAPKNVDSSSRKTFIDDNLNQDYVLSQIK